MLSSIAAFMLSCFFSMIFFLNSVTAETIFQGPNVQTTGQSNEMIAERFVVAGSKTFQPDTVKNDAYPLVEIRPESGGFGLYRYGTPYYVRGVGGIRHIEAARAAGANSVRTWSSKNIEAVLNRAEKNQMTVLLGIWLSHNPSDYLDENYRSEIVARLQGLLNRHKDHPALLMWALGNEINLHGNDNGSVWQFVNELAGMIKAQDGNHPVISVISYRKETLDKIARHAPDLDALGINAYGGLPNVRAMVEDSNYKGPYLITEWGVTGHWEADRTEWGRPIEPPSAHKVESYHNFYVQDILGNKDRCLGSYVFLWGQKQERTPTWYSMFIEHIPGMDIHPLACATVDVMGFNWSGVWPANRAPEVSALTINGISAHDNVSLYPGTKMQVQVTARDRNREPLEYVWEILEEPVKLGIGGSMEPRPAAVGKVLLAKTPEVHIQAPQMSGFYRLFVYVIDGQGKVGTANVPFQVNNYQAKNE